MCDRWFCLAKSKVCSKFILITYSSDGILRILSTKKTTSCVYSVWKWTCPAYTQYCSEWWFRLGRFCFILSIRRTSSISYWVYAGSLQFHTDNTQETARTILSLCRMSPVSYWVCTSVGDPRIFFGFRFGSCVSDQFRFRFGSFRLWIQIPMHSDSGLSQN